MKVWVQVWTYGGGRSVTSISKTKKQIDDAVAGLAEKEAGTEEEDRMHPNGDPFKITIPDDSEFVIMVQGEAVFLNDDEMDIVYDAPENN